MFLLIEILLFMFRAHIDLLLKWRKWGWSASHRCLPGERDSSRTGLLNGETQRGIQRNIALSLYPQDAHLVFSSLTKCHKILQMTSVLHWVMIYCVFKWEHSKSWEVVMEAIVSNLKVIGDLFMWRGWCSTQDLISLSFSLALQQKLHQMCYRWKCVNNCQRPCWLTASVF